MRRIVVTGGTGGLGIAVVTRLARDYRCTVLYHGDQGWQALRRIVEVDGIKADLSNESDVQRALGQVRDLYAVVHLVGGFDADANAWSKMMSINFTTAVNVLGAALPGIEDGGRIVAISSYVSLTKPAGLGAYVASKSALNALIQTLAIESKKRRIGVNALLPDDLGTAEMRERVAEVIAFLLSDAASNITGALIPMLA
ncbi:MAG TPA: SDR family NAD(P)-dependent oxidoreductase [Thermoanaerobaculia bacterium]|nr:SDR family NAD(P)-dependent oxidoreductase [Thermoanaerobaculia bacterium]